ncbi:MAG: hypothetical protein NC548_43760 [Lachnospiraceae bacterium]|nr:hypothetical protein [Corallococcus sp.]MCM1221418.1 hypothetical protein [Lachnospiraceae bacterium]
MAKYVGKIFKASNDKLHIRGNGAHYVHVKWYNPFTRKFKCKVLTSLDKKKSIPITQRDKAFVGKIVTKLSGDDFVVFSKSEYDKIRKGEVEPIPVSQTENLDNWTGYSSEVYLMRKDLKQTSKTKRIKINKKPWY